jgi:hypothetical protein
MSPGLAYVVFGSYEYPPVPTATLWTFGVDDEDVALEEAVDAVEELGDCAIDVGIRELRRKLNVKNLDELKWNIAPESTQF